MRRCLKGLGGRPTSTDGFILGPVTRLSGSACFLDHYVATAAFGRPVRAKLDSPSVMPLPSAAIRAFLLD
jgi:hypothetical protein